MFKRKQESHTKQSFTIPEGAQAGQTIVFVQKEKKNGCLSFAKGGCSALLVLVAVFVIIGIIVDDDSDGGSRDTVSSSGSPRARASRDRKEPTQTPQAGTGDNPAAIGDTVTMDGLAITVHTARTTDSVGMFAEAGTGEEYVVLDVAIENVSDGKKSFNTLYWSAKDIENGYTFDDEIMASTGQDLGSGELDAGDLIRGNVVIKIREDSRIIRFKYDTSPLGGENLYWVARNGP